MPPHPQLHARLLSERALNMPAEAYGDGTNTAATVEEEVRKAIHLNMVRHCLCACAFAAWRLRKAALPLPCAVLRLLADIAR